MVITALLILLAYLIGSISNAIWVSKYYFGIDIREYGSKNAGATNMLRVLGRRAALPVFILDVMKGSLAVALYHLSPYKGGDFEFYLKLILVAAVVLGHIFPIFSGFRGGKGVATLVGAVLVVYPPAVLLSFATFMVILLLTKYVSLSSMISGIMFPIYTRFVFGVTDMPLIIFGCATAILLLFTHKKNIVRLIKGTESKIYLFGWGDSSDKTTKIPPLSKEQRRERRKVSRTR